MERSVSGAVRIAVCMMISLAVVLVFTAPADAAVFTAKKPKDVMATAVKTKASVTWRGISGAKGYYVYESVNGGQYKHVRTTKNKKIIRSNLKKGKEYSYYVVAYRFVNGKKQLTLKSDPAETTVPKKGKSTIKNLMRAAKAPIGKTMYIYGGGWNEWTHSAGKTARRTGLYSGWRTFASKQTKKYKYMKYLFQSKKGLDCTGFVGWCVYNTMNTKNGKSGYVIHSSRMGQTFAKKGFGKWTKKKKVKNHKAGDIMSANGHAWIVVGDCSDGSTVLIHSSPPGVRLAGTYSKAGKKNSMAAKLARKYMKAYYPAWYAKFPKVYTRKNYNTYYGRMRWYSSVLEDPDGYRKMTAEEVLKDLFGDPDALNQETDTAASGTTDQSGTGTGDDTGSGEGTGISDGSESTGN